MTWEPKSRKSFFRRWHKKFQLEYISAQSQLSPIQQNMSPQSSFMAVILEQRKNSMGGRNWPRRKDIRLNKDRTGSEKHKISLYALSEPPSPRLEWLHYRPLNQAKKDSVNNQRAHSTAKLILQMGRLGPRDVNWHSQVTEWAGVKEKAGHAS